MNDPARFEVLDTCLTPARMAPYLQACAHEVTLVRRLYVWNIEVSAAFWGPISGVEIALRNAVHGAMVEHFQRADWWNAADVDPTIAQTAEARAAELARQRQRASPRTSRSARVATADDVVATLSLGFWSSVLQGPEDDSSSACIGTSACTVRSPVGTTNRTTLRHGKRSPGASSCSARNRIAHHESIRARELGRDHELIMNIAGFVHPALATFLHEHSRVPQALARRVEAVQHGLGQF